MSTTHTSLFAHLSHSMAHTMAHTMDRISGFEPQPLIAVACSGGIDSMVLTHLLAPWVLSKKGELHVLIVDHGLRPESPAQCRAIASYWQPSLPHTSILSVPPYSSGNTLAWARKVRYHALQDYCQQHDIFHLLIAHQAHDNAENFMMRLETHAGIHGLASIKDVVHQQHLRIIRPLLSVSRNTLEDYHSAHDLPLAHDPSNDKNHTLRIKWRHRLKKNPSSHPTLNRTSHALRNLADLLDDSLRETRSHIRFIPQGLALPYPLFVSLHLEAKRLILRDIISYLTPSHRLREHHIQKAIATLPTTVSLGKTVCSVRQGLLRIRITP